jgi:hypothetical protein
MQACSQFHEEAFLLETTLREIMDQSSTEGADLKSLQELLIFEKQVYEDLSLRIDSSLRSAMDQARTYYVLKPMVEQLDSIQ